MKTLTQSLLSYRKVTHLVSKAATGFEVTYDNGAVKTLSGPTVLMTKEGIGTVVIRDGLKCPGTTGPKFKPLTDFPAKDFLAQATTGYQICIYNTRTNKSWTFDLARCCGVGVSQTGSSVYISHDPTYTPIES